MAAFSQVPPPPFHSAIVPALNVGTPASMKRQAANPATLRYANWAAALPKMVSISSEIFILRAKDFGLFANMSPARFCQFKVKEVKELGASHTHPRAPFVANGLRDILDFGILLLDWVSRISLDLTRSLILGEVQIFLDFALAAAQLLVAILMLEGSADIGFEFLTPLVDIGDVGFQLGGALLEALNGGF